MLGYRDNETDETYNAKFIYAAKDYNHYEKGTFYMHGDLNLQKFKLKNFIMDPWDPDNEVLDGYSMDGVLLLKSGFITSDGNIDPSKVVSVKIKKGFIVK